MPNFQHHLVTNRIYLAFVDGKLCPKTEDFYKQVSKALLFPDYFGHNLDALDEALSDLKWLSEKTILLLIFNYDHFLSKEKDKIETVHTIFSNATSELEGRGVYFSVQTQVL